MDIEGWRRRSKLFETLLSNLVLSTSPMVEFRLPYLLTEAGRKCKFVSMLPDLVHWSPLLTPDTPPPAGAFDCFSIERHQSFDVLYSVYMENPESSMVEHVTQPHVATLPFYHPPDMPLGYYLEAVCMNPDALPPTNGAELRLDQFCRTFAHGDGRLKIEYSQHVSSNPSHVAGQIISVNR